MDLSEISTWEWLIEHDVDIHVDDDYALGLEAYNGHLDVVKYLIEKGADIHTDDDWALCKAAEERHLDIAKCLVGYGANIYADGGDWALRHAALDIVKYFKSLS